MSFGRALFRTLCMPLCCSALHATCIAAPAMPVPQCPGEFNGNLVQVRPADDGWQGLAARRFVLRRATIVVGPPDVKARAELRGDERRIGKSTVRTTYSGLDAHKEKWLVCGYGAGSDIEQASRLPDEASICVIESSQRVGVNGTTINLMCK